MKREDVRAVVLGVVSSAIAGALGWLLRQPLTLPIAVVVSIDAALFAALAWILLRFGPRMVRESQLATRRMVLGAFLIGVSYQAASEAADGSVALGVVPLTVGASIGVLIVLRRTRDAASRLR